MQLISKFNKGFRFLLYFIDIYSKYACVVPLKDKKGVSIVNAFHIYSKYACVVPLKDKKGVSIVNAFQSILNKSNRKPSKI